MQDIPLYITPPHTCSYLPDRVSRMLFVDPNLPVQTGLLSKLSRQGFRRSGDFIYKPECHHCRQCMSVRIPARTFTPNKSQKRTLKLNQDLTVNCIPSQEAGAEHYALYAKYIHARHADGDMYPPSLDQFNKFLVSGFGKSLFLEFRDQGRLVCAAVSDVLDDGLSAVYTFFDPDYSKRSLGTFAILEQVRWARLTKRDYVYLGYWVPEAAKMAYKSSFMPLEILINERWHRITRKFTEKDIGKLLIALRANHMQFH